MSQMSKSHSPTLPREALRDLTSDLGISLGSPSTLANLPKQASHCALIHELQAQHTVPWEEAISSQTKHVSPRSQVSARNREGAREPCTGK